VNARVSTAKFCYFLMRVDVVCYFGMTDVPPPSKHYLSAALGWLELGNPAEAGEEIAHIAPEYLEHPDVLELRWQICAAGRRWEPALEVAELLMKKAPENASAWLHRAYALRRVPGGSLAQAWEALLPASERFGNEPVVPYNLACYAAQLGRTEEAWDWLQKAIKAAGDAAPIKKMALADADLKPLWPRVEGL
jgi:tetratricopeptide (TPR) repeat protein